MNAKGEVIVTFGTIFARRKMRAKRKIGREANKLVYKEDITSAKQSAIRYQGRTRLLYIIQTIMLATLPPPIVNNFCEITRGFVY